MKPKKLTRSEIGRIARQAMERATDFIDSEIQPRHLKAARYFEGKCDLKPTEGRSKVVATKCRDAVRQVKPSLLRVWWTASVW